MAATAFNSLAVADWHSASNPFEDAEVEDLAQVVLGAVSSVDIYKGAARLMDMSWLSLKWRMGVLR